MEEYTNTNSNDTVQNGAPLRYCTQCGAPVYDEAVGCPNCDVQQTQVVSPAVTYTEPITQYVPQPIDTVPEKPSGKPNLLVVLILSAAAVGTFLIVRLFNIGATITSLGYFFNGTDITYLNSVLNDTICDLLFCMAGLFMVLFVAVGYKKQPINTKFVALSFLFMAIYSILQVTEYPVALIMMGVKGYSHSVDGYAILLMVLDVGKAVLFFITALNLFKGRFNKIMAIIAAGAYIVSLLFAITSVSYISGMFYFLANSAFAAAMLIFALMFKPDAEPVPVAAPAADSYMTDDTVAELPTAEIPAIEASIEEAPAAEAPVADVPEEQPVEAEIPPTE